LALSGCAPRSVDPAAEEEAVRAVTPKWLAFNEARDAAGIAGLFTQDGRVTWQERNTAVGRDAVEAYVADSFAFSPDDTGTFGPDRVDVAASGDLAVEQGTWQDLSGGGRYITVYRKVGGDWKIASDMSVNTSPNGGAPAWATDLLEGWYEAFNARDAEQLANSYYAPDARSRNVQGRKAIIAEFRTDWEEADETCSGSFDRFQVVEKVGVGWGRDTCTKAPADGGPTITTRSNWIGVYEQQPNGSWLCTRETWEEVE